MSSPWVDVPEAKAGGSSTVDYFATLSGSNYFNAGDNSAFDITGDLSVTAWIKPDATCIASAECMILNKESSYEFAIRSGTLQFALTNSSGAYNWTATSVPIRAGVWTHVAFGVSRSTNTLHLYVNGRWMWGTTSNATDVPGTGNNSTGGMTVAATLVNLSTCPTTTSWKGKAFASKDFALIPLNLGNPDVTAGKFYGVFFTGPAMVGTAPVGAAAAMQRAKTISTTTTTTTTTTPWSSFKNQNNTKKPVTTTTVAKKTTTATTAAPSVATVPATLLPGNLAAESVRMSAVRVMNAGAEDTYVINSLTVNTCLGAGRNIVMLQNGRCTVQIAARRDGKVQTTISTKVVDGTVTATDTVVAVAEPTVIKFRNGTALSTPAAKKVVANISSDARRATAILVTGHTGNSGGESATMTSLSQKRALAARSLLRDRGVTCVIAIQSYGATHTVSNSKKEAQQALNRRAEIYIVP